MTRLAEMPDGLRPDVVIVSAKTDVHARAVMREIELLGRSCLILENKPFPAQAEITYSGDQDLERGCLGELGVDHDYSPSVWLRRYEAYSLTDDLQGEYRTFAARSTDAAFEGLLCGSARTIVNDPTRNRLIDHKPFQLRLARRCGLPIPRTLITNDPRRAEEFILREERVITKALVPWRHRLIETRFIDRDKMPDLEAVKTCPVLIQAFLPSATEYRVTVVGDEVFTAEYDLTDAKHQVDGRLHVGRKILKGQLPRETEEALMRFHRSAGLIYGAYDLRCDGEGVPNFLEVNPDGQFLFAEIEAGLPISASLAKLLISEV